MFGMASTSEREIPSRVVGTYAAYCACVEYCLALYALYAHWEILIAAAAIRLARTCSLAEPLKSRSSM